MSGEYIVGTMNVSSMIICFLIGTSLVLMGAYSMINIGTTLTPRAIYVGVALFAFDVYMFYAVFEVCSAVFMRDDFSTDIGKWLGNMVPHYRTFLMLVLLAIGLLRMDWVLRTMRNTITQFSVGETLELIPVGVSFSDSYGRVMQCNNTMDELSFRMTGSVLVSETELWDKITSGNLKDGTLLKESDIAEVNPRGRESHLVRMEEGTIWLFTKTPVETKIGVVSQILAVDATKEEKISRELNESNQQLMDMNQRLRRYHEEVDDTVRSEELLEAKMRVHDKMGETLIAAKMFLTNPESPVKAEDVLKSWMEDLALLREESKGEEAPKQTQRLMDAAKHLGINLIINGNMPEHYDVMNLICVGIQECMTNAIQHAGADKMEVSIEKDDLNYSVVYTNNGNPPKYPIKEGGGLKLLKETAEKMHASIKYGTEGPFVLNLTIPRPENDF